jgi:hypothetical protein
MLPFHDVGSWKRGAKYAERLVLLLARLLKP